MENMISLLSAGIGAGLMAIINTIVNHKMQKTDKEDKRITALVNAQKIMMIDKVRWYGGKYIVAGEISLSDKETLLEMYDAYKELGGNGHLDPVMAEIEKLRVVGE